MSERDPLVGLVHDVAEALERSGFAYAVIGALARNAWARPRATTDADFALAVDAPRLAELRVLIDSLGLRVRKESGREREVPELLLLCAKNDPSLRIDFLIAQTPFEESVLVRRRKAAVGGASLWVASPEDLLVYKLVAARPRDLADADEVARTRVLTAEPLDWDYIERWLEEFGMAERARELRHRLAQP